MSAAPAHRAVLLREACACLRQSGAGAGGVYVDATFGRGGHSAALLDWVETGSGRVIALDRDAQAIAAGRATFAGRSRLTLLQARFGDLQDALAALGVHRVDGVLMDLGVSSPQLDQAHRGFSFTKDGPLDMRMDDTRGQTAAEWLAEVDEATLARVLREYGEEPQARRLAGALVAARATQPIATTGRLAELVIGVLGRRQGERRHPATRVFQAVRMAVNDELGELARGLSQALALLAPAGVLCVVSFHSLEDRMVKRFLRDRSRVDPALARLPVVPPEAQPVLELLGGPVRAGEEEVGANPRARSAILRAARRRGPGRPPGET